MADEAVQQGIAMAGEAQSRAADRSVPPGRGSSARAPKWWQRPWVVPLMMICGFFIVMSVPRYLTFNPLQSLVVPREGVPFHYPVLVLHVVFGTIALVTSTFQVWPWFRQRYPLVHRWMGRTYFFAGVFPGGLTGVVVSALHNQGVSAQIGNGMLAVLWLVTGIAGYRMARRRRYREHRKWMIRSFALTFSIVLNRVWVVLCFLLAGPQLMTVYQGNELAMAQTAVGASVWLSWVVNLLVAEWWLQYRHANRTKKVVAGPRAHAAAA